MGVGYWTFRRPHFPYAIERYRSPFFIDVPTSYGQASPAGLPGLLASGSGTFTPPVFSGTAAITLPPLSAAGTGLFTEPVYSASAAITLPPLSVVATGTFTAPVYSGSATITLPPLEVAATGLNTGPIYLGTVALVLPPLGVVATGTFTAPVYSGTAALVLPPLEVAATGNHGIPVFTGTAAIVLPALEVVASGTMVAPVFTGTAALLLPALEVVAAGVHGAQIFTGSAAIVLPPLVVTATGTFTPLPVDVTGEAHIVLPPLGVLAEGTFRASQCVCHDPFVPVKLRAVDCEGENVCGVGYLTSRVGQIHATLRGVSVRYAEFVSSEWEGGYVPPRSTVVVGGESWTVVESTFIPPCTIHLKLCRPVIECPDVHVNLYRPCIDPECSSLEEMMILAEQLPASLCAEKSVLRMVNGAEEVVDTYRLVVEWREELRPGMVVERAGPDGMFLLVTEVQHNCAVDCLPTGLASRLNRRC